MTTWFTSDEHYGHKNIIGYCGRPFSSVSHMTEELVHRHNLRVKPGDIVWHLGDFALDERYVPEVLPRLHGTHYLVAGNHDKCFKGRTRWQHHEQLYLRWGFKYVHQGSVVLDDSVNLCHFPTADEDTRYEDRRPRVRPGIMLCGHVHERWKRRGPNINVGVDQWNFAPVTLEELL